MQRLKNLWASGTRGKVGIISGVVIALCGMCVCLSLIVPSQPGAQPTQDVGALQTHAVESVIAQTTLNAPTMTPGPTDTPLPTDTPIPTETSTPEPQPIMLTGTGDSIIDVAKASDYAAILHAKHTGASNFAVTNYNANNERIDLLINTIGNYEGTVPLDFRDGQFTTRLEVNADGPWEFQILPLSQARRATIPGTIQGIGDDVIFIEGTNPDTIKADNQGDSNFAVYGYSESGIDLIFNEIAPYSGTALLNSGTFLISVQATGNWSLEITTR